MGYNINARMRSKLREENLRVYAQSKIVRVWVIRLDVPIYDYKLHRNYVIFTLPGQTGSPLISTNHVNERKQSRPTTSLCCAREGEARGVVE